MSSADAESKDEHLLSKKVKTMTAEEATSGAHYVHDTTHTDDHSKFPRKKCLTMEANREESTSQTTIDDKDSIQERRRQ